MTDRRQLLPRRIKVRDILISDVDQGAFFDTKQMSHGTHMGILPEFEGNGNDISSSSLAVSFGDESGVTPNANSTTNGRPPLQEKDITHSRYPTEANIATRHPHFNQAPYPSRGVTKRGTFNTEGWSEHTLRPVDRDQVMSMLSAAKEGQKGKTTHNTPYTGQGPIRSFQNLVPDGILTESTIDDIECAVPGGQINSASAVTIKEPCRKPITAATPSFNAILVPVTSRTGGTPNMSFTYRVRDDLCVLQWSNFEGLMASSGTSTITVPQSIYPLPVSAVRAAISVIYRGIERQGWAKIDPMSSSSLTFILGVPPEQVQLQDSFSIHGGNIQWIPDPSNCGC